MKLKIPFYPVRNFTAFFTFFFFVCIVWDKSSSWVDLSIMNNMCFLILGLVLETSSSSSSTLGSFVYIVWNLLGEFRYCSSFSISPILYTSSIMLLSSVKASVWPDMFNLCRTFNLAYLSILLDGMIIFNPSPSRELVSSSFTILHPISQLYEETLL